MENKKKITTQELVITALFIAMVYVATWLINVRLPLAGSGGLIHLGNVPLFIGAMLFGRRTGALAGACGMGLFDIMSGWGAWAPFTFVIVGLMGYTVGYFAEKKPIGSMPGNIAQVGFAIVVALLVAPVLKLATRKVPGSVECTR